MSRVFNFHLKQSLFYFFTSNYFSSSFGSLTIQKQGAAQQPISSSIFVFVRRFVANASTLDDGPERSLTRTREQIWNYICSLPTLVVLFWRLTILGYYFVLLYWFLFFSWFEGVCWRVIKL